MPVAASSSSADWFSPCVFGHKCKAWRAWQDRFVRTSLHDLVNPATSQGKENVSVSLAYRKKIHYKIYNQKQKPFTKVKQKGFLLPKPHNPVLRLLSSSSCAHRNTELPGVETNLVSGQK